MGSEDIPAEPDYEARFKEAMIELALADPETEKYFNRFFLADEGNITDDFMTLGRHVLEYFTLTDEYDADELIIRFLAKKVQKEIEHDQ